MVIDHPRCDKFLEALLNDFREEKQYRNGHVGRLAPPGLIDDEINDALEQIGIAPAEIAGQARRRTEQIMRMENVADPIDAYEKAVCEILQRKVDLGETAEFTIKIPGWDDLSRHPDARARFIGTPDMHRARATQLREAANHEYAEKLEKLALMIERRDGALDRAHD